MIEITHIKPARAADPDKLARELRDELRRQSEYVRRAMVATIQGNGSTLFATLENSVRSIEEGPLRFLVAPGARHARMVDQGTGPAAGKARYFPARAAEAGGNLYEYVRRRAIRSIGRLPRAKSKKRAAFDRDIRDRARGLARFIYAHGTKAHPFIAPTVNRVEGSVQVALKQAVERGLAP